MESELVFAVGDIHARLDLLHAALRAIAAYDPGRPRRVVFLGDYVDRGPDAKHVVELLMRLDTAPNVVCLKGNHEQIMAEALTSRTTESFEFWMRMGGRQTLASYGAQDLEGALEAIPDEHLRWITRLPLTSGDGHRVFVHAGLQPGAPLEAQDEAVCLCIRDRFLNAKPHQFPFHVVHGHTPTWEGKPNPAEPELLPHRTNLDLAAYETGALGVAVFDTAVAGGPLAALVVELEGGSRGRVRTIEPGPPPARRPSLELSQRVRALAGRLSWRGQPSGGTGSRPASE